MGTIGAGFSMSLDGFIADKDNGVERLFAWMFQGDQDVTLFSGDTKFDLKVSAEKAEDFKSSMQETGVIISGRGMFDTANAWGGKHPMGVPVVVVTHHIPPEWDGEDSPFTFITDGIEHAVTKAREIAGDKNIGVGGAELARQFLKLGLLDEIHIDLVPVLLGEGVRLFEMLGIEPVEMELIHASASPGVTHLSYRVNKKNEWS